MLFLDHVVTAIADVPGVEAIVLGGSRARGRAEKTSDYDLGLYYCAARPLDTSALLEVARSLVDDPDTAEVTPIGGWGPWIVGGAWLSIEGRKVDLIYRNVDAVAQTIANCSAGNVSMHYQPGHPHGFCPAIWMGEVALRQPLHDPQSVLARLKATTDPYPRQMAEALIRRFQWEILFTIRNAEAALRDRTQVAGCAYRALACIAQVLFALNERYLINEKGALREAAELPLTIAALLPRVAEIWRFIGVNELATALSTLRKIDRELTALTAARHA